MSREANLRRFWPSDVFLGNGHLTRPRGLLHALSVGLEARCLLDSPGISDNPEAKIRVSRVVVGREGVREVEVWGKALFAPSVAEYNRRSTPRVSTPYNVWGATIRAVIRIVDNKFDFLCFILLS